MRSAAADTWIVVGVVVIVRLGVDVVAVGRDRDIERGRGHTQGHSPGAGATIGLSLTRKMRLIAGEMLHHLAVASRTSLAIFS